MADPAAAPETGGKPPESAPSSQGTPPVVDVQAQINQALATQQAEFAKQLKEATGHSDIKALTEAQLQAQGKLQELADNRAKESAAYKHKFESVSIKNALLSAASGAIDPEIVSNLLSSKAVCDEDGNVTIDGKPVTDAVNQLLKDKLFLAKAHSGSGSGASSVTGGAKQLTRAEFDQLPTADRSAFLSAGGTLI